MALTKLCFVALAIIQFGIFSAYGDEEKEEALKSAGNESWPIWH